MRPGPQLALGHASAITGGAARGRNDGEKPGDGLFRRRQDIPGQAAGSVVGWQFVPQARGA